MDDRDQKNKIQCVVEEGVLVNRRDIVRVLRDLGMVRYVDLRDEIAVRSGQGYVTSVVSNFNSSTIITNNRLYLNVNNFEYLRMGLAECGPIFDLVDGDRVIRLIPVPDSGGERPPVQGEEAYCDPRLESLFGDSLAEVYLDDEDDEDM